MNIYNAPQIQKSLMPIVQKTFEHFTDVKNCVSVVKNSIPILYFGDLIEYLNSSVKIITVALNPSDKEFSETRFDVSDKINSDVNEYLKNLSKYFFNNPYSFWFNNYEKLLQHLDASYYSEAFRPNFIYSPVEKKIVNTVLHTDICSPIATSKTWSKLMSKNEREFKSTLQTQGREIWVEMIEVLNPDIILISGGRYMCDYFEVHWKKINLPSDFNTSHEMKAAKYNESDVYWFSGKNVPISFRDIQLATVCEHIYQNKVTN